MAKGELTPKQRRFIELYLGTCRWNATRAAREAGYATPNVDGTRLLAIASIRARVEERLEEAAMAADEVLARLAEHARSTLDDFVSNEDRVDLARARERGVMHLLKEYSCEEVFEGGGRDRDPDLIRKQKIKLHDAQAALVQIGRHHGLFTDKVEASGPGGQPIRIAIGWDDGPTDTDETNPAAEG